MLTPMTGRVSDLSGEDEADYQLKVTGRELVELQLLASTGRGHRYCLVTPSLIETLRKVMERNGITAEFARRLDKSARGG